MVQVSRSICPPRAHSLILLCLFPVYQLVLLEVGDGVDVLTTCKHAFP